MDLRRSTPPLVVPELVRARAIAHGEVGRRWLAELPDVIARLAEGWGLALGDPFEGGTASLVVAATDESGRPCVLKVAAAFDEEDRDLFARSVAVHHLADGQACARLLDHDDGTCALLLERLGPNLDELGLPLPRLLEAIATTLRAFWRPLPQDVVLPTGADQARWLAEHIVVWWDELDRPCPEAVVRHALACCDSRAAAFDPDRAVLVHGDAHGWNTLEAGPGAFKFVDPEGLWSEPAHDLGIAMREYNEPLLAGDTDRLVRERADRLAAWCDVDPEAVWEWGFIERVSTGLLNRRDFGDGAAFLEVARRCL